MNVEKAVVAMPFGPPCFADPMGQVARHWSRLAALKEAEIGAQMLAASGRKASKPNSAKRHNAGTVSAASHAGRILAFLFLNGSGRSSDPTPFRAGIDSDVWRSTFSKLRDRGLAQSEAGANNGNAHVWRLTDKGRAIVLGFREIGT